MFGLWKKCQPVELRPPTFALIDGYQGATVDFYRAIEEELMARRLPDGWWSRPWW